MSPHFNGPSYDPYYDQDRLEKQLGRVYAAMIGSDWLTLSEIAKKTSDPEASVSAQLRHLRKPRFGGYTITRRRRGDRTWGLWEYQLTKPKLGELF